MTLSKKILGLTAAGIIFTSGCSYVNSFFESESSQGEVEKKEKKKKKRKQNEEIELPDTIQARIWDYVMKRSKNSLSFGEDDETRSMSADGGLYLSASKTGSRLILSVHQIESDGEMAIQYVDSGLNGVDGNSSNDYFVERNKGISFFPSKRRYSSEIAKMSRKASSDFLRDVDRRIRYRNK